eukprot:Unigene11122_Nuclearia_a/m.34034 Unigene11122_Nuclearia_a/g.34034  ORF Unigene11122_Nuclearia_a/g.34034 Unigene11122_Nuclearia_a/m.34034 type:complete len:336 (+) Unigene11122_Nuclearia_a:83-1090(+)
MLFSSAALVALVGGVHLPAGAAPRVLDKPAFSPHWLRLVNTKRKTTLCELKFPRPVLSVKLNRKRVVVVLVDRIDVFDIANMKLAESIETASNPSGLCALTPSSTPCLLAYPSRTDGEVVVHDLEAAKQLKAIAAHLGPIECIAFSPQGDLIATASDKGTLIRVINVQTGQRVFFFRRGTYPATITGISFSADGRFLAVSSTSETVHVFRLDASPPPPPPPNAAPPTLVDGLVGWASAAYAYVPVSYLPTAVADLLEPTRNFAFARVPEIGSVSVCAVHPAARILQVATSSGVLYEYSFDEKAGGEGVFRQKFSLLQAASGVSPRSEPQPSRPVS